MFLREETYETFIIFAKKKIQVKYNVKIARLRSDHGIEFENTKMD